MSNYPAAAGRMVHHNMVTTQFEPHSQTKPAPSAAKAAFKNKAVIAALKRCATQNQVQYLVFPQPVKGAFITQRLRHA